MSINNYSNKFSGYIKLHRSILSHWIWLEPRRFQWWIELLFMAAWEPKKISIGNVTFILQIGQIATSIRMLSKKFICSNQTVVNFLTVLMNHNMIVKNSRQNLTIITIVNYKKYQNELFISSTHDISQNLSDIIQKAEHNLEHNLEQYIINNNIIYSSHTRARERDLKFFEELKISEAFFEQLALSLKIELVSLKEYFLQFKDEMLLKEKFHESSSDYRRHFISWVKILISRGARPNTNNYNGTGQKETTDKIVARRGTDVGNHTADDFGGPF